MAIAGGGRKNGNHSHDNPSAVKERQAKRRATLDQIARAAGYPSWTVYETAVINGKVRITNSK